MRYRIAAGVFFILALLVPDDSTLKVLAFAAVLLMFDIAESFAKQTRCRCTTKEHR